MLAQIANLRLCNVLAPLCPFGLMSPHPYVFALMFVPLCLRPYVVDRVRESNVPLPCKKFDQTNVSYNKINWKKNIIMQNIIRLGKENFTQVFF